MTWARLAQENAKFGDVTYGAAVDGCDLYRAWIEVEYEFPERYNGSEFFYYLKVSDYAARQAAHDPQLREFLGANELLCKANGISVDSTELVDAPKCDRK